MHDNHRINRKGVNLVGGVVEVGNIDRIKGSPSWNSSNHIHQTFNISNRRRFFPPIRCPHQQVESV